MSNILSRTYDGGISVTLSDTTADPKGPFAGVIVGTGGTLKLQDNRGDTVTFAALLAGQLIQIATTRVWSTGTSATVFGLQAVPFKPPANAP
jgi:hypothetical protein